MNHNPRFVALAPGLDLVFLAGRAVSAFHGFGGGRGGGFGGGGFRGGLVATAAADFAAAMAAVSAEVMAVTGLSRRLRRDRVLRPDSLLQRSAQHHSRPLGDGAGMGYGGRGLGEGMSGGRLDYGQEARSGLVRRWAG